MVIAPLVVCFILNFFIHGNILGGILNTTLLALVLLFFKSFSGKKISSISLPYLIILGAVPLFNHKYDTHIVLFALGLVLLFIIHTKVKRFNIFLAIMILIFTLIASFYASEIIKLPFIFKSDRLIFNDKWGNIAIAQMPKEALYLPHSLRSIVFNSSGYFYAILTKIAELFMFKNLYDVLFLANLYPLFAGVILYFKSWSKEKLLIILSIFLISSAVTSSTGVDIFNTFLLMSPFLMYFILNGFSAISKKIYLILVLLSLLIII